jgi:antitoxin (DNA-binding transcriptional repressor) of toxin-antitoxin stability system
VIIARGKKPVARLVPIEERKPKRQFGAMRGRATVGPEFFEPLPPEELDAWDQ